MDDQTLYSNRKNKFHHAKPYLLAEHATRMFRHTEKAYAAGVPLNRFVTMHLHTTNLHPQKFIGKLMEHTRKWLKQRNLPCAYLWVLENGMVKGVHVHILLHVPAGHWIAYKKAMKKWLPFPLKKPWVDTQGIGYAPWGELHPLSKVYGILKYICKGIEPQKAVNGIRPSYQGLIIGRRCGMSKPIMLSESQSKLLEVASHSNKELPHFAR